MKKLLFALSIVSLFTLTIEEAQAAQCTYHLKNSYGNIVKVVNGYDSYSSQQACLDASRGCQNQLRRTSGYGLYCAKANNGGYGNGNGGYGNGGYGNGNGGYGNGGYGNNCRVELVDRRGYRIQTFYGNNGGYGNGGYGNGGYGNSSPSVCREALRECNRYKTDYNYRDARCQSIR